jgi:hypothetical protein
MLLSRLLSLHYRLSSFLSSIASHLTSYLLDLIYTTICASISLTNNKPIKCNDPTHQNDVENKCQNYDYGVCLSENGIGVAHNSNDLTQIVALRKFFLDGLGGKILRVLHRVGGTVSEACVCVHARKAYQLLRNVFSLLWSDYQRVTRVL